MSKKNITDFYEKTILSSFIAEPWTYAEHRHRLKSNHFLAYGFLIDLLDELFGKEKPFDVEVIESKTSSRDIQNLYDIVSTPAVANVLHYIDELKEYRRKGDLLEVARTLSQDDGSSSEQILFKLEELLEQKDVMLEARHKNFNEWAEYYKDMPPLPRYPTGVSFLDFLLSGGVEMGQLMLISGAAEAGKTSMGIQILKNVSKVAPTVFFSFEFTVRHFIEAQKYIDPKYQNANMTIINDGMDLESLSANIRLHAKNGTRFFLIDSQMRVDVEKARNSEEEESRKFSTMAKLAHKYDLFIIFIIQTSKTDPNSPIGSKKGSHESSITIHIEHVPVPKDDVVNSKNPWLPTKRSVEVKKNKQTGKHYKEEVGFNPENREFYMIHESQKKPTVTVIYDEKPIKMEKI